MKIDGKELSGFELYRYVLVRNNWSVAKLAKYFNEKLKGKEGRVDKSDKRLKKIARKNWLLYQQGYDLEHRLKYIDFDIYKEVEKLKSGRKGYKEGDPIYNASLGYGKVGQIFSNGDFVGEFEEKNVYVTNKLMLGVDTYEHKKVKLL